MAKKQRILVVDDEKGVRDLLEAMLEKKGHDVTCLADAESALQAVEKEDPDLIITDLRLPGMAGEELVEMLKQKRPSLPVVVISGFGKTKDVVEVIKRGAENYLPKPFTPEDLEVVVFKALEKRRLLAENERLKKEVLGRNDPSLVGRSKALEKVLQRIQKFAASDAPVLITGESGVGKELAAWGIHAASTRSGKPWVVVNAGALPPNLIEAELFGVKKGAFTGAGETRGGLFQEAHGGTLFLDEIAEVPMESQAKLLRVLETGEVRALGDSRSHKVDVRVLAATNQDLEKMVEQKAFRKDLFYRLSVLPLPIPPLRQRAEDIPLLADHFLKGLSKGRTGPLKLSTEAMKWLMSQNWPGNIRELKNLLERSALLAAGPEIKLQDLDHPASGEGKSPKAGGLFREAKKLKVNSFEKEYLTQLLSDCQGNVSKAALRAGLARRNFQLLLKKHRLNPSSFKKRLP